MRRTLIFAVFLALAVAACDAGDGAASTTSAREQTAQATTTVATPPTVSVPPGIETDLARFITAFGPPGACFDVTYAGDDFDYAMAPVSVDCDGPHDHEVFYVGELPGEPGTAFPGEDGVAAAVFEDTCIDEFTSRFGAWSDTVDLALWAAFPLEEEWESGLRTFACSVTGWLAGEGDPLTGDVASAGLTLRGVDIAVVAEYDGRDVFIYGFADDGSRLPERNLTDDGNAGIEDTGIPSWSPDGSAVAFGALDADGNWDIWVIDVASGEKTRLMADAPVDSSPVFSPDGSMILFTSRDRADGERDIWVMDADGSNLVRLTEDPGTESSGHWSPDGSRIVFRSAAAGTSDIWVMDADGSNARMLVDLGGGEYDPRWSPDGGRIAFISDVTGDYDIWVVGVDGGSPVNLTRHPADDEYPSWTPDGEFIVFNSNRRGAEGLWVMRSDGSDQSDLLRTFPTGWGSVRPAGG